MGVYLVLCFIILPKKKKEYNLHEIHLLFVFLDLDLSLRSFYCTYGLLPIRQYPALPGQDQSESTHLL